jgi:hypothetical protein
VSNEDFGKRRNISVRNQRFSSTRRGC